MNRLDGKAARERLNAVMLAIVHLAEKAHSRDIARMADEARRAIHEVGVLITCAECEREEGHVPSHLDRQRCAIREQEARRSGACPYPEGA